MRIAIVALNAESALFPNAGRRVGGMETFAWSLARGLAECPEDQIAIIVRYSTPRLPHFMAGVEVDGFHEPLRDVRQSVSSSLELDGFRKLPRVKRWDGSLAWKLPALAFAKLCMPRFAEENELRRTMQRVRPDLVIALGVNPTSAMLVRITRDLAINMLLSIQSNADLARQFFVSDGFVDSYGVASHEARTCLLECPNIVCQTQTQWTMLQELGRLPQINKNIAERSVVIPNPIDLGRFWADGSPDSGQLATRTNRTGIVWIGRADRFHKRPLLALEIARACPQIPFTMIVNRGDAEVHALLVRKRPDNVTLVDYHPADQMPDLLRKSWLFLSTSSAEFEGFPNVLLEASASGTPIVSLEDFDGFLARSQAGLVADGNTATAANLIQSLADRPELWNELAGSAMAFVQLHHERKMVIRKFRDWILRC